jgi:hypothetical protein
MPCRDGKGPRQRMNLAGKGPQENAESCSHHGTGGHHGGERHMRSGCCCEPSRKLMPLEEIGGLESAARQLEEDLKDIRERIEKLRPTQ